MSADQTRFRRFVTSEETVFTASEARIKKKKAFAGVRSGKSKKLWVSMPEHPAKAPIAIPLSNLFPVSVIARRPFLNRKYMKEATAAKASTPPSASV